MIIIIITRIKHLNAHSAVQGAGEDDILCRANWTDYRDRGTGEGVSLNKRPSMADRFSAKLWRGTAAVGSERRSPVRVAEDDSSFVPSLSPNQFSLASPK